MFMFYLFMKPFKMASLVDSWDMRQYSAAFRLLDDFVSTMDTCPRDCYQFQENVGLKHVRSNRPMWDYCQQRTDHRCYKLWLMFRDSSNVWATLLQRRFLWLLVSWLHLFQDEEVPILDPLRLMCRRQNQLWLVQNYLCLLIEIVWREIERLKRLW